MSETGNGDTTWVSENRRYQGVEHKFQRRVTVRSVITNKTVRGWMFLTIFAASVPILVYYFVIDGTYVSSETNTCLVQTTFRVKCGKENITSNECLHIHCCFDQSTEICYHYLPSKYSYSLAQVNKYTAAQNNTPFHTNSLTELYITIIEKDENKVGIILSQENQTIGEQPKIAEKNYKAKLIDETLMVEIYRNNDDLLLTTAKGPLIASENYWEWSFYLTNHTLFGLDGTIIKVSENSTFKKVIYKNKIEHSTLPVLWAYYNKKFHGVVIKNEGPLEIEILPSNLVILRSLTGTSLELELSVGPTPKDLHDQHMQNTELPPIWALETNNCRRGKNINLTELLMNYNLDSQESNECIHENLVMGIMADGGSNTENVRNIIKTIKEQGYHFLLSIPPHVLENSTNLYNRLLELDMLFKYGNSTYQGRYLDKIVGYPDYGSTYVQNYLEELFTLLGTYMDILDIDGIILHDNWPVNENYSMDNATFPYLSKELEEAMSYTLPWNTTRNEDSSLHIQNHNVYGTYQISSFKNYFQDKTDRSVFIMSATKTFGQVEASIIQNINASWSELGKQINNALFNSISGNHLVSFPVCGDTTFFDNALQEVLCLRWYLVAATMPLHRISSYEPLRNYKYLDSTFAQQVALNTLASRQMLIPHYYTLLSKNEPVIRPMFYDYYQNETTFLLTNQYMIGDSVLVAHPFSARRTRLQIYLPSSIEIWYELWGGQMYNSTDEAWMDFNIVETDFVAFIAQGNILPLKNENTLNLIVALNCSSQSCEARGIIFEINYIYFVSNETALTVTDIPQTECNFTLGSINLYYYENGNTVNNHVIKNEDLCTDQGDITILY